LRKIYNLLKLLKKKILIIIKKSLIFSKKYIIIGIKLKKRRKGRWKKKQ